ncbi:uncharacterized protein LOC131152327 [Malania oleifera]|uniref:uncharacterized protein LOC131152327 n=1 Tax=Malania oleifera TaxID=397392 RepID=UPI0025ADF668|nr:uncharacterized protein LOC131152327 [Malania oleifera]
MGCGESKHNVATGNAITLKKSNDADPTKKAGKDVEAISETGSADKAGAADHLVQAEEREKAKEDSSEETNKAEEADVDVKDIISTTADAGLKEKDAVEESNEQKKEDVHADQIGDEPDRFITSESPNCFFSSRRDEESIQRIVSDQEQSERSEYFSPRHLSEEINVAVGEKELIEETKPDTGNGEAEKENEEKVVKEEAGEGKPNEAKEPINADKDQEQGSDSPTQDQKTN